MNVENLLRKKLSIVLGLSAALVAVNLLVYFFGVSNLEKYTRNIKERVGRNEAQVKALEAQDKEVSDTVSRLRNDKKVVADLAGKILQTRAQRLVGMQTELQKLCDARGLQVNTISYGYSFTPPVGKSAWERRYLQMAMQIPLAGPYQEVKGLIKDLQDSPQFFVVDDLSLSSDTQGGVLLKMQLRVVTYFVAAPEDMLEGETKKGRS